MLSYNHVRKLINWAVLFAPVALFSILGPVERAWSADFDLNAVSRCIEQYVVSHYGTDPNAQLGLQAGDNTLADRVWKAFREKVGDQDPTAMKSDRWDLIPMNALVKPLIDPQEAAVAEMMAIDQAKHDVWVGTYIFGKDAYAFAKLAKVKAALARGVSVHILLDSEGTPDAHHDSIKALHSAPKGYQIDDLGNPTTKLATVDTVMFDPPTKLAKLLPNFFKHIHNIKGNGIKSFQELFTRRMHTKILGVDMDYPDGMAFIGGRNKDGLYYGYEKVGPKTYNDTEIMIRNDLSDYKPGQKTLANTLAREFRKLQGHLMNRELEAIVGGDQSKAYAKVMAKAQKADADMWAEGSDYDKIKKRFEAENFLNTGFDAAPFRFLSEIENINRPSAWKHPDLNGEDNLISITKNLNHFAKNADEGITIVTPYPNMTPEERAWVINRMLHNPDQKFTLVTNSIYSGDNLITQYVVDYKFIPGFKAEAKAAALKNGMTEAQADQFVKRFNFYALGRLDGKLFGGTQDYGKLHAKYVIFQSKDPSKTKTVVMSYNGDNISRFHNAEVGGSVPGQGYTYAAFQQKTQDLIAKSYVWGSDDWKKLRSHPKLRVKRLATSVISRVEKYLDPIE